MNILDIAIAKQLAGGSGGSGTDNYNDLSNLPKINDTTLSGNKSSSALGLQSEITNDNKLSSDLVDDANKTNKFVTSTEKQTWNSKQNAIDADHKINADYVDDSTSTNKFVTADNKETWNAKQNAIDNSHKLSSDLVDDANHTNKFVTSTEKTTWNNKQNAIDADHKLSSSLVSFTTAEAAALASGIDSAKVSQISTNQTNILYSTRTGAQNLVVCNDLEKIKRINRYPSWTWEGNVYKFGSASFTVNGDGSITVNGTFNSQAFFYVENDYQYDENESRFKGLAESKLWGCPAGGTDSTYFLSLRRIINGESYYYSDYGSGINVGTIASTAKIELFIGIRANTTVSNKTFYPSFTLKSIYDQDSSYCLGALPNSDLTYLEAEDRAALAEVVDSGAKNKWANGTSGTINGWRETFQIGQTLKKGNYIISFDSLTSTDTDATTCQIIAINGTTQVSNSAQCPRGNKVYTILEISADANAMWIYSSDSSGTGSGDTATFTNGMICTKVDWDISKEYVPYRPSYQELYDRVVALENA